MINQNKNYRLTREEWEFSNVPNTLLKACFLFEYSRESVKEGNKLPVELLDIISIMEGFPKRPFQRLSPEEQEGVFVRHKIDEDFLSGFSNPYLIHDIAASILLEEIPKKKKSNSRMSRKYLKQLGVYRLFKAGHSVESAMEFTFQTKRDDDWLSRGKYRDYQRAARKRVHDWPSCVIPRAEFSA